MEMGQLCILLCGYRVLNVTERNHTYLAQGLTMIIKVVSLERG